MQQTEIKLQKYLINCEFVWLSDLVLQTSIYSESKYFYNFNFISETRNILVSIKSGSKVSQHQYLNTQVTILSNEWNKMLINFNIFKLLTWNSLMPKKIFCNRLFIYLKAVIYFLVREMRLSWIYSIFPGYCIKVCLLSSALSSGWTHCLHFDGN